MGKRKASGGLPGEKTGKRIGKRSPEPDALTQFRVEIWRIDPEIRLASFPLVYRKKEFKCADILWQIAEHLIGWLDARIPLHDRPLAEVPFHESVWLDENRYEGIEKEPS
jgi:hypothetical protein